MRRASSTPEMISTRHPVADFTHSRKAWELRASRSALVATTRTVSVTICCVVRWKRRRTLTVSAIDSGVRKPERKTPSPRRVTSRSSWTGRRCPRVRRAILSRTELEPISTAAKVGMRQGQFTCRMGLRHHKAKGKILNPGDTGYTDAQCSFVADCSGAFDGGDILF